MRTIQNDPNPSRLIEGMRDTGYEFKTAVADIIDNSIVADANKIEVQMHMDPRGNVALAILDDGEGMSEKELIDAMKYGASKKNHPLSLGKFGLGLKTASTAFCRELVVVTIDQKNVASKAIWDLDYVAETNGWNLIVDEPANDELQTLSRFTKGSSGTMVIWRKVDRLLKKYKIPGGRSAKKAVDKYIDELRDHLAMVFQRFTDVNDKRVAKKITLFLNKEKIEPWNPFKFADVGSEDQAEVTEEIDGDNVKAGSFEIKSYYFPRPDEMPNHVFDHARIKMEKQGIFIYRENRMIYGPDWLGIVAKHNSYNRVRVEFSFDHLLDDLFQIDVKKSQVTLTEELQEYITEFLKRLLQTARKDAKKHTTLKTQKENKGIHTNSNNSLTRSAEKLPSSKISIDPQTGQATVKNLHGEIPVKNIRISDPKEPGENHIQPVESIVDGLLWEPALVGGKNAVSLNTSHPYYQRVYSQIRDNPDMIKGLDYLLWALTQAELSAMNENAEKYFNEYRYEVSKILRMLANDLPEIG